MQLARTTLAMLLATLCAIPLPAAPAAGKPATRSRSRRYAVRYRGVPTFADSSSADDGTYDDPVVRAAAVSALGRYNGAVVAVDPNSGRILTVVNQKIAFSDGYIPCSTIKPAIALAALEENVITRDTMLKVSRRKYMNLTEAMAHSNNVFFEQLGARMGFETVSKYGRLLGLGELATDAFWAWANWPGTTCQTSILAPFRRRHRPMGESRGCPASAKGFR